MKVCTNLESVIFSATFFVAEVVSQIATEANVAAFTSGSSCVHGGPNILQIDNDLYLSSIFSDLSTSSPVGHNGHRLQDR